VAWHAGCCKWRTFRQWPVIATAGWCWCICSRFQQTPVRVIVDYTTPSKRPSSVVDGRTRRCAVCLGQELQLGPFGARSDEHEMDFCVGQAQASENSQKKDTTQDPNWLLQYCPSKIWAFSLVHRSWREVRVTELDDVVYPDVTGTELYIRPSIRELFESLVGTHVLTTEKAPTNGPRGPRGCNVLLQGNPGTGKSFILGTEHPPHYVIRRVSELQEDSPANTDFNRISRRQVQGASLYSQLRLSWNRAGRLGSATGRGSPKRRKLESGAGAR
jgi:hypothetical protein